MQAVLDARERGYTISTPMFLSFIFCSAIGLAVYLIRTRGVRGIVSILLAFLFGLAMTALEQIAIEITNHLM